MMENIKLVFFSFTCSVGLGIVFRIDRKNLVNAGLGGALIRAVYLVMVQVTDIVFVQYLLAAMVAACYSEIMAIVKKMPATVFLYPAIIPILPGSTLYYIAVNLILGETEQTISYLAAFALSLGGICLGFVLNSTFRYYRQIYIFGEHIESGIKTIVRRTFVRNGKRRG